MLDKVLEPGGMPATVRLKALQGLAEAAATRKLKPAGDLRGVAGLMDEPDPAQRLAALKLVGACGVAEAAPVLGRLALDSQAEVEVRQGAIGALVALRQPASRQVLEQLAGGADGLVLRMQAVAGLTEFDLPLAADWGAKVLAAAGSGDNPTPLLAAFFNRKEGSVELARALGT
ncbi:MAG: HEAT repeat domain-containing protein, partial [Planctomycetaceae bacterium]